MSEAELSTKLVSQYLKKSDWEVKENANMKRSFTHLLTYLSAKLLRSLAPKVFGERAWRLHGEGWIHIHKLPYSLYIPYCFGISTGKLLMTGIPSGHVASAPAKHLISACDHIKSTSVIISQEMSGANAFSSVDLFLAPLLAEDKKFITDEKVLKWYVKQSFEECIWDINYPYRYGYQCLSEDTEILTSEGWKKWYEVKEGDLVYTYNLEKNTIELKPVKAVHVYKYKGVMYRLSSREQDQLITPNHRIVRWCGKKSDGSSRYKLEVIEDVVSRGVSIIIPVTGECTNRDYPISDEWLKLLAWILADGTIDRNPRSYYRILIYQSKTAHYDKYLEIKNLLESLGLEYKEYDITTGFSTGVKQIKLSVASSTKVRRMFGWKDKKEVPKFLYRLSKRQARIFIETFVKGDGWVEKDKEGRVKRMRVRVTDKELADVLQALGVIAGYNVTVKEYIPKNEVSKKIQYEVSFYNTKTDTIKLVEKVPYEGIVWCVTTDNGTIIARRNGKVFITGNSPFINFFISFTASRRLLREPAVVGGKLSEEYCLGDFIDEAREIIRTICDIMLSGDAWGRPFTFPILSVFPTREIMEDEIWYYIALLTAKRGSFYFLNPNVVDPDSMFSMCCRLTIDCSKVRSRGVWTIPDETGSIGVVTINMARVGMEAVKRGDEKYIYDILYDLMRVAKYVLSIMRERYYKSMYELDLMPLAKKLGIRLENFYSTVGLVALPEFVSIVLQRPRLWYIEDRGTAKEVVKIYRDVLSFVNKVLDEWGREDNILYNVEQVPAESCSYRLAVLDYEKYPEFRSYIPVEVPMYGSEKVPFYSSQNTPSYCTWDLRLQLEIESEVQPLFTGGVMKHIFLGRELSVDEVTKFVRYITENTKIVYFSLTPVQTTCNDCGFWTTGMYSRCPKCGSENVDIWSRIVGYYRPVRMWNVGRRAEFRTRLHYMNIPI